MTSCINLATIGAIPVETASPAKDETLLGELEVALGLSLDNIEPNDKMFGLVYVYPTALGYPFGQERTDIIKQLKLSVLAWAWQYSVIGDEESLRMCIIRCMQFEESRAIGERLLSRTPQWFQTTLTQFPIRLLSQPYISS